jgi:hypothetical protein
MSVTQIAESFVYHDAFLRLSRPVNSLLSGPRGSGKTTLMKMLQPMALELWNGPQAETVRTQVTYTGVFVATDRTWKRQLEPYIAPDNPFRPELEIVANASFSMHVVRELLLTMAFRTRSATTPPVLTPTADIPSGSMRNLTINFARLLRVEGPLEPTFGGLADALSIRLAELQGLQVALRQGRNFPIPAWIQVDCISVAEAITDMFNRAANQPQHRWALLFDEMELAPPTIVLSLLDSMRGQPQHLLLKLSLSPLQPELSVLHRPYAGVHGQDFELIQLNHAKQSESLSFARSMLMSALQRRNLPFESPKQFLGNSLFSSGDDGTGGQDRDDIESPRNPYAMKQPLWKRFASLAQGDVTFRDWLDRNGVALDGLDGLSPVMRASKLRKVRNLVVVREFYRRSENRRRSRKTYELYSGADTVIAFLDGNARMLTALIGHLIEPSISQDSKRGVSRETQSRAVDSIIRRFFALIYAAEGVVLADGTTVTLADLVHRIGQAISEAVVDDPFSDNVPLSFYVDRRVPAATVRLIHLGINMGVFIHIPRKPDAHVPLDLEGEKLRLCYVLAPFYGLPVRLGPAVGLTALLSRHRRSRRSASRSPSFWGATGSLQQPLFDDSESVNE